MYCISISSSLQEFVVSLNLFHGFLENFKVIPFAGGKAGVWANKEALLLSAFFIFPWLKSPAEMQVVGQSFLLISTMLSLRPFHFLSCSARQFLFINENLGFGGNTWGCGRLPAPKNLRGSHALWLGAQHCCLLPSWFKTFPFRSCAQWLQRFSFVPVFQQPLHPRRWLCGLVVGFGALWRWVWCVTAQCLWMVELNIVSRKFRCAGMEPQPLEWALLRCSAWPSAGAARCLDARVASLRDPGCSCSELSFPWPPAMACAKFNLLLCFWLHSSSVFSLLALTDPSGIFSRCSIFSFYCFKYNNASKVQPMF